MLVKRNARNRIDNKQQNRGEQGKKTTQFDTQFQGAEIQNSTLLSGSRFAIFETEEEAAEDVDVETILREPKKDGRETSWSIQE